MAADGLTRAGRPPRRRRPAVAELLRVVQSPPMAVWCLYQILSPFYIVDSGLPQPGDALVFLLFPLALAIWNGRFDRQTLTTLRPLLWFTTWVVAVNYGWALVLWRWSANDFVLHPFFYVYNVVVVFSALVIAKRDPRWFLRVTVFVTFLTVMFQVAASFVYRTEEFRGSLFFNSPNQLGYYALLAACLFAMTQRPLGLGRLRASIGVTGCAYLCVLSSSRAALAGIAILLVLLVFSNPKAVILGALVAIGLVSIGGPIADAIETTEYRTLEQPRRDGSFAEERGYDRLWDFPEYLLIGAGEGAYERFAKPGEPVRELHSSFGSVVFSYGVIGVALFVAFGIRLVRGAPLRSALMLVPVLAYTVAHQGLRFTMFWVVIAAFMALKQMEADERHAPGARVRTAS